jgi:hypothetical protein
MRKKFRFVQHLQLPQLHFKLIIHILKEMQGIQFVEKMETAVLFLPILLQALIKQD